MVPGKMILLGVQTLHMATNHNVFSIIYVLVAAVLFYRYLKGDNSHLKIYKIYTFVG